MQAMEANIVRGLQLLRKMEGNGASQDEIFAAVMPLLQTNA